MEKHPTKQQGKGEALLHTFSFWLVCDLDDPPQLIDFSLGATRVRLYPPFRSGLPNFTPMPKINPHAIPFLAGQRPHIDDGFRVLHAAPMPVPKAGLLSGTMSLQWGENWEQAPANQPVMDSIRVDLMAQDLQDSHIKWSQHLDLFLQHLREASKQWWIGKSIEPLIGSLRSSFKISQMGAPVDYPSATTGARTPFGFERTITQEIWTESHSRALKKQAPPEESMLLLEAHYQISTSDFRAAILSSAMACEIVKERVIENLWHSRYPNENYKRGKALKGYDLPAHLDRDMKELSGESFQEHNPAAHRNIETLWRLRNKVAHGRELIAQASAKSKKVDEEKMLSILESCKEVIIWLRDKDRVTKRI